MVQAPGFFTFAEALVRMAWSRSVAVIFSRSPSASIRKLDRIGMVVLRSTTLCVAVSSFTNSWRLTVISIDDPCTTGFSTSVSMIGIALPSLENHNPRLAPLYNTLRPGGRVCLASCFDCIHVLPQAVGGKEDSFLESATWGASLLFIQHLTGIRLTSARKA